MKNYKIGDTASIKKMISEADIESFASLTGDYNPLHSSEEFAKNTVFKSRVAHGMLTASFISAVLGTILPGAGAIYLEQNLKFTAPVYLGEEITVTVTVLEFIQSKNIIKLETNISKNPNITVIEGVATLKLS